MIDPNRNFASPPGRSSELVARRDVLKGGGLGALSWGLGRGSVGGGLTRTVEVGGSVILLAMVGGASPWETFDPKPDAPERFRGPFGSIASAVPGVRVSEHLPEVARRMGNLTILRSIYHEANPTHEEGLRLLLTGQAEEGHQSLGSKVARSLGPRRGMPPFVVLPRPVILPRGIASATRFTEGISSPFDPFVVGETAGSPRFDPNRVLQRANRWVDVAFARGLPGETTGLKRGWDWNSERPGVRSAYGASEFARNCWLAGRMVEAGSRLVVVNMAETVFGRPSWDGHGRKPFSSFDDLKANLLPAFDQGFSGLVDDLRSRGLLESTLVVAVGEFGRTPWINESGGRDHWPHVWSALVAGGRSLGGQVIGASDLEGRPVDRSVPISSLMATMASACGISPASASAPGSKLVASPIAEIFG